MRLECCKPFQAHAPSGLYWWHSRSCPRAPREKIRRVFDPANQRRSEALARETADAGVTVITRPAPGSRIHPACKAAWDEGIVEPCPQCAPMLHSATCTCPPCEYWWAHVDDEVDR